jgi:membrane protease YdiL (CAAX protease family)
MPQLSIEEQLVLVPVLAEFRGDAAARDYLTELAANPKSAEFAREVELLVRLYAQGQGPVEGQGKGEDASTDAAAVAAKNISALSAADTDFIKKRFGWSGELALTRHLPAIDPQRAPLLADGLLVAVALGTMGLIVCLGFFVGAVLIGVFVVLMATGRIQPRMQRVAVGGSVGVETLAVFVASFLGLKLASELLVTLVVGNKVGPAAAEAEGQVAIATLILQWMILPIVLLWPMLRRLPQPEARRSLGLHTGTGLFKEIGAGIVGYIASIPLLIGGAVITLIMMAIVEGVRTSMGMPPTKGPVNPLLDYFTQGGAFVILLAGLAIIWAPLVEEVVFRGGMLRQLHSRMNIIIAAILTALFFAFMHGYPIFMMGPIIGLALGFAMMRWWRGSLISAITAHAIHNGGVSILLFVLARALT